MASETVKLKGLSAIQHLQERVSACRRDINFWLNNRSPSLENSFLVKGAIQICGKRILIERSAQLFRSDYYSNQLRTSEFIHRFIATALFRMINDRVTTLIRQLQLDEWPVNLNVATKSIGYYHGVP